jgi:hypothetical protein
MAPPGVDTSRGLNHAVPVLQTLKNDRDMVFNVFPLMSEGFFFPWYHKFSEVLDVIEQVLEVRISQVSSSHMLS